MGCWRKIFICAGCVIAFLLISFLSTELPGTGIANGKALPGNKIASIQDISINIYQNERTILPKAVKVKYRNGKTQEVKAIWDEEVIDTSKVGKYTALGSVEGYKGKIKCVINIEPLEIIIANIVILPENSYDKKEADRIIERISRIYPGILNGFLNKGIHIKLINTPITALSEFAYLKGMLPRGWEDTGKTWDDVPGVSGNPIAIRIGYSEPGKGHGAVNLELHEIAHTVDGYLFNAISSTKEFKDIWKKEVNALFGDNNYFLKFCDEYFAEAFAMFYLDNEHKFELSNKAPLTFKFIEHLEEIAK